MEDILKNPEQFSKGLNLNDSMNLKGEFHLDMDFKKTKSGIDATKYWAMVSDDDEDSDTEDIFTHVEKRVEEMMLSSPEYLSFAELEAKMVEVPCYPSGAVKITILEEGDGPLIPPNAEVTYHYAAYWEKGKIPFDSTLTINDGNPKRTLASGGRSLVGLEVALRHVRGPTARFLALLQPPVAWGTTLLPPRIQLEPALFVVALYSVKEMHSHETFNSLPSDEQGKYATTARTIKSLRATAKEHFQKQRYRRAIEIYQQAIHVVSLSLPETEQEIRELKNFKIKLFVNLAVCYYKLNKPHRVIDMCKNIDRIIPIDTHCKALFYKGKAYEMMGKLEEALENYKKALKLEPNNTDIGALLAELDGRVKRSADFEVEMWRRVFNSKTAEKTEEKTVKYRVDDEFEQGARELCQDLANRTEYTKVEMPVGLLSDEVECLRYVASCESGLRVEEDGVGRRKRVAVIKVP